jgi:F-type H+-transporting ATPase subunit c
MTRKNIAAFFTFFSALFVSSFAFAAEEGSSLGGGDGAALIGAALAISIAAVGGALGQARAGAAALEGIARNPGASGKVFTPMILALALIESLVIYALLIAFSIVGKVG